MQVSMNELNKCFDNYLRFAPNHEEYVSLHKMEDMCFGKNWMLLHLVKRLIDTGLAETKYMYPPALKYQTENFTKAAGLWIRNRLQDKRIDEIPMEKCMNSY